MEQKKTKGKCRVHISPRTSDLLGYLARKELLGMFKRYTSLRGKFALRYLPEEKLKETLDYLTWLGLSMQALAESQYETGYESGLAAMLMATKTKALFTAEFLRRQRIKHEKEQKATTNKE